jgi:hypothetical protein
MPYQYSQPSRRELLRLAGLIGLGSAAHPGNAQPAPDSQVSLFDGKTLDGWAQIENNATSFSAAGITDTAAFAVWLSDGSDAVSEYLRSRLQDSVKGDLAGYSPSAADAKAVVSALVKDLNQIVSGPSIYEKSRFSGIILRRETAELAARNPRGPQLARLNKLLLEDAYPEELAQSYSTGWVVKDGVMASTGEGRGVIYTVNDYARFRLTSPDRTVMNNSRMSEIILIANGDLRLSANRVCWEAQQQTEEAVMAAIRREGAYRPPGPSLRPRQRPRLHR